MEGGQWRKWQMTAGNSSYLHEVGRVAGWEHPPLGRGFPLLGDRASGLSRSHT